MILHIRVAHFYIQATLLHIDKPLLAGSDGVSILVLTEMTCLPGTSSAVPAEPRIERLSLSAER